MTQTFKWFSKWRETEVPCSCGWSGLLTDDLCEPFNALLEFRCPKCEAMLAVVGYPSEQDIQLAMNGGHPDARAMWPQVLEARRSREERHAVKLYSADQLPDLPGAALSFVFDAARIDKEDWFIIRCEDREVWREYGTWEHWERFNEVKNLLKARYGSRFVRMDPTRGAEFILYGDRLSSLGKLEYT